MKCWYLQNPRCAKNQHRPHTQQLCLCPQLPSELWVQATMGNGDHTHDGNCYRHPVWITRPPSQPSPPFPPGDSPHLSCQPFLMDRSRFPSEVPSRYLTIFKALGDSDPQLTSSTLRTNMSADGRGTTVSGRVVGLCFHCLKVNYCQNSLCQVWELGGKTIDVDRVRGQGQGSREFSLENDQLVKPLFLCETLSFSLLVVNFLRHFSGIDRRLPQLSPWPHSFCIRFCCNLGGLSLGRFLDFRKKASALIILGVVAISSRLMTLCVGIVDMCVLTFYCRDVKSRESLYFGLLQMLWDSMWGVTCKLLLFSSSNLVVHLAMGGPPAMFGGLQEL